MNDRDDPGLDRPPTPATSTPVEEASGGGPDAYEATTWEVRSSMDRFSVFAYEFARAHWGLLLVLFAVVLLIGQFALAGVILLERPLVMLLVLLSLIPALVLAGWVYRADFSPEPITPVAVTFTLGGTLASVAALTNAVTGPVLSTIPVVGAMLFFFLFVAPVEETVKWLAVRLYAYRHESFTSAIEGAVYGAVAGLGFATVENAIYVVRGLLNAAQVGAPLIEATAATAVVRSLIGPGHVVFTAIAGYYLGLAKANPTNQGPIAMKGLLIASIAHATYNTLVTYAPPLFGLGTQGVIALILAYIGFLGLGLGALLHKYRSRVLWEARQEGVEAGSPS